MVPIGVSLPCSADLKKQITTRSTDPIVGRLINENRECCTMDDERHPADSHRLRNLIGKFRHKAYRDSYIASHTRRFLARQMRKFRGERSQSDFGDLIDKRQTVVSRLEDPKYGK